MRLRLTVALVTGSTLLAAACNADPTSGQRSPSVAPAGGPSVSTAPPQRLSAPEHVTIAAAGDIACAGFQTRFNCADAATARLIVSLQPDAVLALGDTQYARGGLPQFRKGYDKTWGSFKEITYPVPGNHEYKTKDARGYFRYFDTAPWYAFNIGSWRAYALNTECEPVRCDRQVVWLKKDLARHPHVCSIAYMHGPRWASGNEGPSPVAAEFFPILDDAQVDVALAAHNHNYERFAPMHDDGTVSSQGITTFVSGSGGKSSTGFPHVQPGSEVRLQQPAGVLFMDLFPDRYSWRFTLPGDDVRDAGTRRCVPGGNVP